MYEIPDQPMDCIHMDIFGPIQLSARGNKYVITGTDRLTRWTEAMAIPDQSANTVIRFLNEKFILNFCAPKQVVTDRAAVCSAVKSSDILLSQ